MMLLAAITLLGWIVVIAIVVTACDLALALLTSPFDLGLFAVCLVLVAVAHTAILRLRRKQR